MIVKLEKGNASTGFFYFLRDFFDYPFPFLKIRRILFYCDSEKQKIKANNRKIYNIFLVKTLFFIK